MRITKQLHRLHRFGNGHASAGTKDGSNIYYFELSDPINLVDPLGLQAAPAGPAATQQTPPVAIKQPPGQGIWFIYNGDDQPTFYQTVEITPAAGQKIPPEVVDHEKNDHNADPTAGPVGDNGSGDPKKPYGTDKNGKGVPGSTSDNGGTAKNSKVMKDSPGFGPPYPRGFKGTKSYVTTVCNSKGETVQVIKWQISTDNPQGAPIIKVKDDK
jgi:hypothetical protein